MARAGARPDASSCSTVAHSGRETTAVAAGMLAPVSEADAQERALTRLGLESARRWPAFAAELADVSGIDVGLPRARHAGRRARRDEAEGLSRELALRERLGLAARALLPSQARSLEPALAPGLRAALEIPGDHAVDPRLVAAALAVAAERAGVTLRPNTAVARLLVEDGRACAASRSRTVSCCRRRRS